MGHERLKQLKNQLLSCVEAEMCNAYEADTEELGEAIDMLKDLEEALYYCTIIEAMEEKGSHGGGAEYEFEMNKSRGQYPEPEQERMYNNGRGSRGGSRECYPDYPMMYNIPPMYQSGQMYNNGGSSMYNMGGGQMYSNGGSSGGGSSGGGGNSGGGSGGGGSRSNFSEPMMMRDYREGRSPESRKMYMESKEHGQDKTIQLRELEKYMQELSTDVVDMIQDSTSDEKQYLEKKLMALASKISQMK